MPTPKPILSRISALHKFNLATKYFPAGISILEVGSGSGDFAIKLERNGYQVTTLDMVEPADIIGDINHWQALGIQAASFDAVVALEVIEHVNCLTALQHICRPGGLIMLSSPHPKWDWLLYILEKFHLLQQRTSEHKYLINFSNLPLTPVILQRPLFIHQLAIFKN